jgi:hypothetical protein
MFPAQCVLLSPNVLSDRPVQEVNVDPITDIFGTMHVAAIVHSRQEATAPWGLARNANDRTRPARLPEPTCPPIMGRIPYSTTICIAFGGFSVTFGGAGRNRTADEGFADPCLATWPPRPLLFSFGRRSALLQH